VDWPTVWAGIPEDEEKREHWCAGFGWRQAWFQGGLHVRTATGARLLLATAAYGRPVTRVEHVVWSARADAAAENGAVTDLATERWPAYLDTVRSILSEPAFSGTPDTPGFPEPPGPAYWGDADWRRQHRDPHRLALWSFRTPGAPLFVLKASLSPGTAAGWGPGSATISLACHGPADGTDDEGRWLL
jgi:hypothetical protein